MRSLLVLVLGLLMIAGCSCEGATTPGATDAGNDTADDAGMLPADVFGCEPLARSICTNAQHCGCAPADLEACMRDRAAMCVRDNAPLLESHSVVVLPRWQECLDRLAQLDPCANFDYQVCAPFIAMPLLQDAGPGACAELTTCADGNLCVEGACRTLPGVGEPCFDNGWCASGLRCGLDIHCAERTPIGDACTERSECVFPAYCVRGTCATPVARGGACTGSEDCLTGLVCEGGHCAPVTTPCTADSCGPLSFCLPPRTCQPPLAIGQPCPFGSECAADAFCGSGTCRALAMLGAHCDDTAPCLPNLVCSHGGTCGPAPTVGSPCPEGVCAAPAVCDQGQCIARHAAGEGCNNGTCDTGLKCDPLLTVCVAGPAMGEICQPVADPCVCIADANGTPRCRGPIARGEACDFGAACSSGLVCRLSGPPTCVTAACVSLRGT